MKNRAFVVFVLFMTVLGSTNLFAQAKKADDILGIWLNEDKDAKVEIFMAGGRSYGKIIWLKDPIDTETGKPKLDKHNPEKNLKSRPILNLEILKAFKFNGKDEWKDGTIYDPKSGKTYSCYMKFESADKIKIRGFVGVSMLGRSTYWTKVK
jgi:uncharacterized protein (DUF2147 family)